MAKETFLKDINVNDEILDFFMVKDIAMKVGSNRKNYLDVTLSDKTGDINGKKWDVSDEEALTLSEIHPSDIVRIKSSVSEWNGVKQLRITRIRKAQKEDEICMTDYIKAAPEDPEEMYAYILSRAESIGDEQLRAVAVTFLSENREKLLYYPAAMRNHHAELGGLLYHIKRMLMMGEKACEVYTDLDRDWVVCGVIIHDMEKLNEIISNEFGVSPGYTFEGKLLGHIVLGVRKISKMAEDLGIDGEKAVMLEHMILAHHYEPDFGSPVRPMFPEAELLHYLDILDANMFDFEDALSAVGPGSFSERVRTLDNRMLYKPSSKEDK